MVVLVVGLAVAFFAPLNDFLAKLNKTYIQCLLETGELPKVGVQAAAVCDEEFPQFQGKNLDGVPDSKDGKNADNSENEKGESSSSDGSNGTDVGGGSSGVNPGNRKSNLIRDGMRSNGSARSEQASDKTTTIPVDDFDAGEGFAASNSGNGFGPRGKKRTNKVDPSSLSEYDRKKLEKEQSKSRAIAVDSESFTQKKNRKLIVKPPPEQKIQDDLNVQTDFSAYFKIFFFIVIILFIIILMGGQAMQMTNNSDN